MATQTPRPADGDLPESPRPDIPDTDEKKRQGTDDDPLNPEEVGGQAPSVPGQHVPETEATRSPVEGDPSGVVRP